MLTIVTPAAQIISAADAKARQPALADAADAVVNAEILSAQAAIQAYLERAVGQQTWDWKPDATDSTFYYLAASNPYWLTTQGVWGWQWPNSYIDLPLPPLASVTSFKYLDADNVEQTWSSSNYIVSGVGGPGRITLKSGSAWPSNGDYPEPIRIRFVVGEATVPVQLVQAVLLQAGSSYTAQTSEATGAVRSLALEGVGTVTYAGESGSSSVSQSAGSGLSDQVRWLVDPFKVY